MSTAQAPALRSLRTDQAPASETVGDGRYLVLNRIGCGGTAAVYCAEDLVLRRKVALKLLYERYADDDELVERFEREASSAARLNHPHIVSIYDHGESNGTRYIAMEYVRGRSLKTLIREEAPLDQARAVDFVIQLLHAARYIHRRGIIHRDLKSENAIVDPDGYLKLTDFGIARAGGSDITQTGTFVGTAAYVSPEQAEGHVVTAASDLYSLGIILYELLIGRPPFEGESALSIVLKHVNQRPTPPSARNAGISSELEAIIMRALEKQPASRFPDAEEFIAALECTQFNPRAIRCEHAAVTSRRVQAEDNSGALGETQRLGLGDRVCLKLALEDSRG